MNSEISLNKNSHVPLFFQIQEYFRKKIENTDIKPGTQLPTERELSDQLDISRVTIRKAMRALIAEGLCEKKVGKGIFVSDEKIPINLHRLEGTTDLLKKAGSSMKTVQNHKEVIKTDKKFANLLNIKVNSKILYLKRIRYIDDSPVILEHTYLPLIRYPKLDKYEFNQSLYEILNEKYEVTPKNSRGCFNIIMAKEEEAKLLNLQLNTPLLVKEATVYSEEGTAIEYNKSVYRADKFNFMVDSKTIE
ncbi:MAG: GntR family transcriptional regulator [Bacillota bacterium]